MLDEIIKVPKYSKISRNSLSRTKDQKLILFATPHSGNLGDHAITEAIINFLEDNFPNKTVIEISMDQYKFSKPEIVKYVNAEDIILVTGGGFLGNLWLDGEYQVRDIINTFMDNKIVIFPQTIYFEENGDKDEELLKSKNVFTKHSKLNLFVRENNSLEFVKENYSPNMSINLVPDIVTYLDFSKENIKREGILFCLRKDKEQIANRNVQLITDYLKKYELEYQYTDTVMENKVEGLEREVPLKNKLNEFKSSELVITDRLHGMIFCLITGTPCIAMDNSSKKISGVYNAWLKDYKFIKCIDSTRELSESEFFGLLKSLKTQAKNGYNSELNRKKLNLIANVIKE